MAELMKYTDLVLLDIKQIDEEEHIKLTGQSNKNILANGTEIVRYGKTDVDPPRTGSGGSDKDEYLHRLADLSIFKNSGESRSASVPYTRCI